MAYIHDPLDLTDDMTANDAPSPNVVSASGEYSASYAAWKAFDEDGSTQWSQYALAGLWASLPWIKYNFGSSLYAVNHYAILPDASEAPTAWKVYGSNDDAAWTELDSQTGIGGWSDTDVKLFTFLNGTAYQYYKFVFSDGVLTQWCSLKEIELFANFQPIVPSESLTFTTVIPTTTVREIPATVTMTYTVVVPTTTVRAVPSESITYTTVTPTLRFLFNIPSTSITYTTVTPAITVLTSLSESLTFDFAPPTIIGGGVNAFIRFPNLSGKHVSLKFYNNDADGSLSLFYYRNILHRTQERNNKDTVFPNLSGTHVTLKINQSSSADLILAYQSVKLVRHV